MENIDILLRVYARIQKTPPLHVRFPKPRGIERLALQRHVETGELSFAGMKNTGNTSEFKLRLKYRNAFLGVVE